MNDFQADALGLFADNFYIDGNTMIDEVTADIIVSRWRQVAQLGISRANDGIHRFAQPTREVGIFRQTIEYMRRWRYIPPELSFFFFLLSLLFFILSLILARSSIQIDTN